VEVDAAADADKNSNVDHTSTERGADSTKNTPAPTQNAANEAAINKIEEAAKLVESKQAANF